MNDDVIWDKRPSHRNSKIHGPVSRCVVHNNMCVCVAAAGMGSGVIALAGFPTS